MMKKVNKILIEMVVKVIIEVDQFDVTQCISLHVLSTCVF